MKILVYNNTQIAIGYEIFKNKFLGEKIHKQQNCRLILELNIQND